MLLFFILKFFSVFQAHCEEEQQQNSSNILQQILDLERLNLSDRDNSITLLRGQDQTEGSCMHHPTEKPDESLNLDLQKSGNPIKELNVEPLMLPFSQMEQGESLWQCKSAAQSGQVCDPLNHIFCEL